MPNLIPFVINLVIFCIVLAILYWIVMKAVTLLPFDVGPATTIVQILFALIFLLWLLSAFQGSGYMFYQSRGPAVIVR
jgi:hypothetical protein